MTPISLLSAGVFAFVLWASGAMPVIRRDFRIVCSILAALGLTATYRKQAPDWYLLWYTPTTIAAAYLFALRHLLTLSQRLDDIERDAPHDLDSLQSQIEQAVEDYNEKVDEEHRLQ